MQGSLVATQDIQSMTAVSELPILGFDCIELYVGNARQAAYFYHHVLGFSIAAYQGPETGCRDTCAYLLTQNNIRLVVRAALSPEHPIAQHVHQHGDGIKDIGFMVQDVASVYEAAIQRGATSVMSPTRFEDADGMIEKATIATYGDTTHTLVRRQDYHGVFEPGFISTPVPTPHVGLQHVDHAVGNVEKGHMDDWVAFYQNVFGFYVLRHYDENDISTPFSALVSKVMANHTLSIRLPINEPAKGVWKSQIQEYLDFYRSAGVQHLAIATNDIVETVRALKARGIHFMQVPSTYYHNLFERVGAIHQPIDDLSELGILVDRDEEGYLLQIFTQPLQDRPTLFLEIIQREGSQGFGKGNFKALFEAIERDQQERGNI